MAARKPARKAKAAALAFDPRSEAVVLTYLGSDEGVPALGGIPARDLTQADISRLVYARAVNEYDGQPDSPPHPDPEKPSQAKARELVELLLSRRVNGKPVYRAATASEAAPPAPDETPTEHPPAAEPVTEPEA